MLRVLVICIALAASVPVNAGGSGNNAKLPNLVGQTLSDKAFRIPDDLPAAGSVVLLGFDRKHQSFIDDWTAGLAKTQPESPRNL